MYRSSAFVCATLVALSLSSGSALAQTCYPQQITSSTGYNFEWPRLSHDGSRIVFGSASDLTGQNPGHQWQTFLYDRTSNTLTQISDTNGDDPTISDDGTKILYRHSVSAGGYVYFDHWLYDTTTGTRRLLTAPANPATTYGGQISPDGKFAVISTNGLQLYNLADGTSTSLNVLWYGNNPSVSNDARIVTVEGAQGTVKFLDRTTGVITTVPGVSTINSRPYVDAAGTRIVFNAAQDLTGENPDGSTETFEYEIATGAITQLSHAPGGYSQNSTVNADGRVAVWEGNHNADGTNPSGSYNVFSHDLATHTTTNVSNTQGALTWLIGVSGDGSQLAFVSNADITGSNPSHVPQLFLACGPPPSANHAPQANAGADMSVNAGPACSASVALNGSASSDEDGDALTYTWTGDFGTVTGVTPTVALAPGTHAVTLTVGDGHNPPVSDSVTVTVNDVTPPAFTSTITPVTVHATSATLTPVTVPVPSASDTCGAATVTSDSPGLFPIGTTAVHFTARDEAGNEATASTSVTVANAAPVANAGPDVTAACGPDCRATVTLTGTASADPDGDALTYTWSGPTGTLTGATPSVTLAPGAYDFVLAVSDGLGGASSDTVHVTVVDGSAPVVTSIAASPNTLWAPNHKMQAVTIAVAITDCDAEASCRITGVTANEPISGADYAITGPLTVTLRAERAGHGSGRVYSIVVRCVDHAGNETIRTVPVVVPHDQR